jgi:lipopolysaccharide export system protein LptC
LSLVLIVVTVAALALLLPDREEEARPSALPAELADAPALHMRDATIVQYREDGTLSYRLLAERLRHYDDEQRTNLERPRLTLEGDGAEPPWKLRAARGFVTRVAPTTGAGAGEEVVYLRDAVHMEQNQANGQYLRLDTSALDYYPERRYAETDRDVMIDTDIGRTRAGGLKCELREGLLYLSSNARQRVHTIVLRGQFKRTAP